MKRLWIAAFMLLGACQAQGVGRLANVQIIDRDTGAVLTPYRHRGEYWVAGRPGARYAIRVRNSRGERVMAVMSVDGINVITGQNGGWNQSGYVFGPWDSYEVAGWRKSDEEIAAFEFTASPNSYAARTGRPGNIGVIGLALFRERPLPPMEPQQRYTPDEARNEADTAGAASGRPQSEMRREAAPASAPAPTAAGSGSVRAHDKAVASAEYAAPTPSLGTGHGAREYSHVDSTRFDKLSDTPDEVIRIRYDSYDNLVAMGVIPRRWHAPPAPEPFPDTPFRQYVPDPPAGD